MLPILCMSVRYYRHLQLLDIQWRRINDYTFIFVLIILFSYVFTHLWNQYTNEIHSYRWWWPQRLNADFVWQTRDSNLIPRGQNQAHNPHEQLAHSTGCIRYWLRWWSKPRLRVMYTWNRTPDVGIKRHPHIHRLNSLHEHHVEIVKHLPAANAHAPKPWAMNKWFDSVYYATCRRFAPSLLRQLIDAEMNSAVNRYRRKDRPRNGKRWQIYRPAISQPVFDASLIGTGCFIVLFGDSGVRSGIDGGGSDGGGSGGGIAGGGST